MNYDLLRKVAKLCRLLPTGCSSGAPAGQQHNAIPHVCYVECPCYITLLTSCYSHILTLECQHCRSMILLVFPYFASFLCI